MAAFHVRSVSLPSGSHPLTVSVEEQLQKLRTSQSSSSSACQRLGGLKDLYESVDDLLQQPLTHQAFSHGRESESAEEALNASLRVLDTCCTTRDVFSQMKECVEELESSLRRGRGKESSLGNEVDAYLVSKKKLNKVISRCLKILKKILKNNQTAKSSEKNSSTLIILLRDVEEISLSIFESVLSSISQPKPKPSGRLSVVSKLLQSRSVSPCEGKVGVNETERVGSELLVLKNSSKDIKGVQVQNVMQGLKALESTIQEFEEELEGVYRRLVKTRVSLLNILSH